MPVFYWALSIFLYHHTYHLNQKEMNYIKDHINLLELKLSENTITHKNPRKYICCCCISSSNFWRNSGCLSWYQISIMTKTLFNEELYDPYMMIGLSTPEFAFVKPIVWRSQLLVRWARSRYMGKKLIKKKKDWDILIRHWILLWRMQTVASFHS